jgi:hypothetical protein
VGLRLIWILSLLWFVEINEEVEEKVDQKMKLMLVNGFNGSMPVALYETQCWLIQ